MFMTLQVSGPLNAPKISKTPVDPKMHLTIAFLGLTPQTHYNLAFLAYILKIFEIGRAAGKFESCPGNKTGPLNACYEN